MSWGSIESKFQERSDEFLHLFSRLRSQRLGLPGNGTQEKKDIKPISDWGAGERDAKEKTSSFFVDFFNQQLNSPFYPAEAPPP